MIERVVLGTAPIGNLYRPISDTAADAVLEASWDEGLRAYDTAPHYGLGLSERRLGRFLRTKPRDSFSISTKVGRVLEPNPAPTGDDLANGFAVPDDRIRRFDPSADGVRRSLDASLERMGLDRVDTVLLHDPDAYDLDEGLRLGLPALADLRADGTATEVGVGVNSVEAAVRAVREGDIDVVMIAGRYTLLEQPAADELLPLCLERGVRVIAVGVFNSGLLAAADPASAHYDYGRVPSELLQRTLRLREVCARFGVQLAAAAMHFPLRHQAVGSVAVGTASAEQLRANAGHARHEVPDELWDALVDDGLLPQSTP